MKNKTFPVLSALVLACTANAALAVDFNGYVRSGLGISADGGGIKGGDEFNKTKLGRLGNEFDTYSEIGLGQEVYNKNGKTFYIDSMFEMSSDGFQENEGTKNDSANFALKQFNIQAKGFVGFAPEATLWAGKRFYQRHDLHIIDTKYWNVSGYGAGIEGVKMGDGALSAAWIRGDQEDLNINYLDLRFAGIKPWSGAWIEVGADYAMTNPTDAQEDIGGKKYDAENGVMITAEYSQNIPLGYNKTVLQFANKGLAQNMSSQGGGWYDVWNDTSDAKGFRIINTGEMHFGDHFTLNHVITYGQTDKIDPWNDQTLLSIVARPTYAWDENNKTILELGYFQEEKDWGTGSEKKGGNKVTISQAISAGDGFFARPEMRVYATYVKDTEGDGTFNDGADDDSIRVGIQVEAWW